MGEHFLTVARDRFRFIVALFLLPLAISCGGDPTKSDETGDAANPPEQPAVGNQPQDNGVAPAVTPKRAVTIPRKATDPPANKAGENPALSAKYPPAPKNFGEIVDLQKAVVEKNRKNDLEKKRLFLMYVMDERFVEADELLGQIDARERDDLLDLGAAYLSRMLGEPREAREKLERLLSKWTKKSEIAIERCVMCEEVKSYRVYTPFKGNIVKSGSKILLYIEPKGFELKKEGDSSILHLKYNWELLDDRERLIKVDAWEKAKAQDREDTKSYHGEIRDFHQNFLLPLPKNLSAGKYTIRVTVEDVNGGKSTHIDVPFEISAI